MNIGKTLSDSGAGAWRSNCPNWSVSAAKRASQGVLVVKNLPANAGGIGDAASIPRLGRSLGERNGNPLQYSCLENSMDRGHRCHKEHIIINYRHVQVLRLYILFFSFTFSFESPTDISSIVIFPFSSVQFSRSVMSDSATP